jgi:hypothetical protein
MISTRRNVAAQFRLLGQRRAPRSDVVQTGAADKLVTASQLATLLAPA